MTNNKVTNDMIEMDICEYNKCIGCGVCKNICNRNAITLSYNNEGFLYPNIDKTKCINCNLCREKCPINNYISSDKTRREYYAGYSKNDKVRYLCSTGGIFIELSKYIINNLHGVVIGATYSANHYCEHKIATTECELQQFVGSKYVQSDIQNILPQAKNYLDKGIIVLFSGTPCQVAAMKNFCSNHENLITVDLFCHGVPSPKVFESYIKEMKVTENSNIEFKNKQDGWNNSTVQFNTLNGKYVATHKQDAYYLGFIKNLYLRKSCEECTFNYANKRPADISIGDFWECEKFYPKFADDKGTNAIIVNSLKGKNLLKKCQSNLFLNRIRLNEIIYGNPILIEPIKHHPKRNQFFYEFNNSKESVTKIIKENLGVKNKVAIMNHSFQDKNYGALLVAYSLEQIIKKMGFDPYTILLDGNYNENFENFKINFLHCTKKFNYSDDFSILNRDFETFIVGSDQVWRNWWNNKEILYKWFLNFADFSKNLISYGASFGKDTFDEINCSNKEISKLLSCFSAISVREQTGIDICKQNWGINAELVIDPTQLLSSEDYDKIIQSSNTKFQNLEPYLAYMIFPNEKLDNNETYKKIKDIANSMNLNVKPLLGNDLSFAEWLNTIKNASFIITESYHGTMFSIIYKKQFISIAPDNSTVNRLNSFFERIGCLQNRVLYNLDVKSVLEIAQNQINYDIVYDKMDDFKQYSINFLKNALSINIINNGREKNPMTASKNYNVILKGVQKIFSIKNEYKNNQKRKVINLIGFKIKYKVKN